MRLLIATVICTCLTLSSEAQLGKLKKSINKAIGGDKLSTEEVAKGLKEALVKGTGKGTNQASKQDGFLKNPMIKILFPPDAEMVESKLRQIGMGRQVDRFIVSMNRAAELAAKEAKPIFVSAIKSMTIQDAWGILKGEDDAATRYLDRTTSNQLFAKFNPIIKKSLDKVNATKYYKELIAAYNKVPMVEKKDPDLDKHVTDRSIDGLFSLIAVEEANIRKNPGARTTDLLKKVFSQ